METTEKQSTFTELVFPVLVLIAICLVCSALLAALNSVTAPVIEANEKAATLSSYLAVLPEGTDAAALTEYDALTTEGIEGAVATPDGVYAVKAAAAGYQGETVTVYVSFDEGGAIAALSIDASTQTPGIGSHVGDDSFAAGFIGHSGAVAAGTPVDTYAGATYSSSAVFTALDAAVDCYNTELKGAA